MKAFTAKLVDLTQTNADEIARQWARDVKKNAKTPSYHQAPEEKIIRQAKEFYNNFQMMFFNESPYEQAKDYFEKFAEERYKEEIPGLEALSAFVLMRRIMWL
jgi:actin-related protein